MQTRNHRIPQWHRGGQTHTSHTVMALDLIFLLPSICAERQETLNIRVGEPPRPRPFFADEMKSLCCSHHSMQAKVHRWVREPGDFFFSTACFFSNDMVEQRGLREKGAARERDGERLTNANVHFSHVRTLRGREVCNTSGVTRQQYRTEHSAVNY